jgi:hypothetical protein
MRRDARELWSKRVERWKDSGLTAKEFAAETGINANTLSHWGWKLAARKRSSPSAGAPPSEPGTRFVEVVAPSTAIGIAAQAAPPSAPEVASLEPDPLEIVLRDELRIRVPVHFDPDALRRVVATLGTC